MRNYTNKIKRVITTNEPMTDVSVISSMPTDYKKLMSEHTRFEFLLSDTTTQGFTIWSLSGNDGALEMNDALNIKATFGENVFAIGSDNGDRLIIYVNIGEEYSLFLIDDYDIDLDDAVFLAESLNDLLYNGNNIELIHA